MIDQEAKCRVGIIKIASRCNINCTYCYMYNKGDDTFLGKPKVMSLEVIEAIFLKVSAHCRTHCIDAFRFVFHGGEPMLAGKKLIKYFVRRANEVLLPDVKPFFSIQTNGMLITDDWCELFAELNIGIGISLDGTREANDTYRIDHRGRGTYDRVVHGLKLAQNSQALIQAKKRPTILTVINPQVDPLYVYEHFKTLAVNRVNFLFPDNTYDDPPPGIDFMADAPDGEHTPYADWLIKIFDRWFDESDSMNIRFFSDVINLILGAEISFDVLGTEALEVLVVETDGSIEAAPALRICGNGFTRAGINILTHGLDSALQTKLGSIYHFSKRKLCKKCSICPVKDVCGGGFIPHRYSKERGFNNPSIYCNDLLKLITHIQNKVLAELPKNLLEECDISPISFTEARKIISERMELADDSEYVCELEEFKIK